MQSGICFCAQHSRTSLTHPASLQQTNIDHDVAIKHRRNPSIKTRMEVSNACVPDSIPSSSLLVPRLELRRYHRSRSTDRRGPQDGVADLSHTCGSDRTATGPVRAYSIQFRMFCYYNRVGSAIPKSDAVVYSLSLRLRRGRWEEFAVQSSTRLLFNSVCF